MKDADQITPPFTRSIAELRETFSEGRLCERDNFGSLGTKLIAWRKKRDFKGLDGLDTLELGRYLHKLLFELNNYLLSQTVTPFQLIEIDAPKIQKLQLSRIEELVTALSWINGVTIYIGFQKGILVCLNERDSYGIRTDSHFGSSNQMMVIEPVNATNASQWVGDIMMAEIHFQRGRAHIAREVFASTLLNAMQVVINQANADFDKAVAVSNDGTKIVHADIVYVYSDTDQKRAELVLWPKHCKEHKVLRVDEGFVRIRSNSPKDQVVMEGTLMGCTELLDDNQLNGRREFHIRRSHVPDILLAKAEPYNPGMHVL